MVNAHVLTIV